MDTFSNLLGGFAVAATPENLFYCFLGVFIGTLVGMLPGLGSASGVAILLPTTVTLEPVTALIVLSGVYFGVQYGGTITSVLVNTPGDGASLVTVFDGYPMARKGQAGKALAAAAIASFVAGTIGIVLLTFIGPSLAQYALRFGPPETMLLMVLGLFSVAGLITGSALKGLSMAVLGILLSTVGAESQTGERRFTFGSFELLGGLELVALVIGLFAIAEVLTQVNRGEAKPIATRLKDMTLTREDLRAIRGPTARASFLGFGLGALPGAGPTLATFLTYDVERRVSKTPERFGKGAIEGVASPEAANNAATSGAFVPTLTLGIPGSATTAVLLGAFLMVGVRPGPLFFDENPELAWGLIASFYIGNVMLLLLNLPLAPLFASLLRVPYRYIYPLIFVVSVVGAYGLRNSLFDVWVALAFGVVGYFMRKYGFPAAPLVLGFVLGGLIEKQLQRTVAMSQGDLTIIFDRPISTTLFVVIVLAASLPLVVRLTSRLRRGARRAKEGVK